MTVEELIKQYKQGRRDFSGANLCDANLSNANLYGVNLSGAKLNNTNFIKAIFRRGDFGRANLIGADFYESDFEGAYFSKANLSGAYFGRADLCGAYFTGAKLYKANLREADLRGAYLDEANLCGANLSGANFCGTNLKYLKINSETNLQNTVLDPAAKMPSLTDEEILKAGLEIDGDFILGWRIKRSTCVGDKIYHPGTIHIAPYFSVDKDTDCHPGIYFASQEWLQRRYPSREQVRCRCLRSELIHAGKKWRARRLMIFPWKEKK